jgi:hypothetical protein
MLRREDLAERRGVVLAVVGWIADAAPVAEPVVEALRA